MNKVSGHHFFWTLYFFSIYLFIIMFFEIQIEEIILRIDEKIFH